MADLEIALREVMTTDELYHRGRLMMPKQMDPSPFFVELHAKFVVLLVTVLAEVLEQQGRVDGFSAGPGDQLFRASC